MTHFAETGREISAHDALSTARLQLATALERLDRVERRIAQAERTIEALKIETLKAERTKRTWLAGIFGKASGRETRQWQSASSR